MQESYIKKGRLLLQSCCINWQPGISTQIGHCPLYSQPVDDARLKLRKRPKYVLNQLLSTEMGWQSVGSKKEQHFQDRCAPTLVRTLPLTASRDAQVKVQEQGKWHIPNCSSSI